MGRKITSVAPTLLIVVISMATIISLARSFRRPICSTSSLTSKHLNKSRICPLWSPSFFRCLPPPHRTTLLRHRHSPPLTAVNPLRASLSSATIPSTMSTVSDDNPLLKNFDFPPFDSIDAGHVRPGMRALLKKLKIDSDLVELEKTVEPSWPKLVEPLEKMMDRLTVVWGAVNHLKAVKDTPELRSAIEEIQPEKVEFDLKLGQSKPLYNAFKAIRESKDWDGLSDAQKRIVEWVMHQLMLTRLDKIKEYL
ncbi:putative oligopeptidase A [Helianthus annuus]|nr:putative oligopeptidase A [Helianthus annuus]KAJ0660317.1 putative oligopeptidase A [Helianthus annuus]